MIRIFTRQLERLGSEEGQALVFVALVGLVVFLFFSMAMNVAELVNVKIKSQNVADAAALSAAVWQARALNLIAASNRNMIEAWAAALALGEVCVVWGAMCAGFFCMEMAIDPLPCLLCLFGPALLCPTASSALGAAVATGMFEDVILERIDMNVVEADLPDVVDLNYAFKPNTARLELPADIGLYMYYPLDGEDLLRAYVPPDAESGDYPLERVGICETLVMFASYLNRVWHETDEAAGLTDDDWNDIVSPTISDWYRDPDGPCFQQTTLLPGTELAFPMAIRTRTADWNAQDVDSLLTFTVATYRVQEPPPSLGKGRDSGDCTWAENDTRFACPNIRHYAFAAAQAYSESVSEFYNTQIASFASPYLIPYAPIVMDWEPRLMPVQGPALQDLLSQIAADGFAEDSNVILNNLLRLGGADFFLY